MPAPKFVVAVGDDACGTRILNNSYAVLGGADKIFRVDLKISGNPSSLKKSFAGCLSLRVKLSGKHVKAYSCL
jgi:Ni,Fe-hydrogenase III small subunit